MAQGSTPKFQARDTQSADVWDSATAYLNHDPAGAVLCGPCIWGGAHVWAAAGDTVSIYDGSRPSHATPERLKLRSDLAGELGHTLRGMRFNDGILVVRGLVTTLVTVAFSLPDPGGHEPAGDPGQAEETTADA